MLHEPSNRVFQAHGRWKLFLSSTLFVLQFFFFRFFPNCLSAGFLAAWPLWCIRHSAGIINAGANSAGVLIPMGHDKIHVATFARPQAFGERGGKKVQRSQGEP